MPAPQGYQRELLTYLVGKPNLNELYDGTQEQMQLLSDLSSIGPKARERAVKVFASRIQAAWQSSSVDNKFDPITRELGRAYNKLKPMPEPTRKGGLQLLHEACTLAKDGQKGPMPTYLYNWVVADYK